MVLVYLIESANVHNRAMVEHSIRVIKQQFGFQKVLLLGLFKYRCKIIVIAALSNLYFSRIQLLAGALTQNWCAYWA